MKTNDLIKEGFIKLLQVGDLIIELGRTNHKPIYKHRITLINDNHIRCGKLCVIYYEDIVYIDDYGLCTKKAYIGNYENR